MRSPPIRKRTSRRTRRRSSRTHSHPSHLLAPYRTPLHSSPPTLTIPDHARRTGGGTRRHVARSARRWWAFSRRPDAESRNGIPSRFAEVGAELARTRGASVVLIGSAARQARPRRRACRVAIRRAAHRASRRISISSSSRRCSSACRCSSPEIPDRCIWPPLSARRCSRSSGHRFRRGTPRCLHRSRIVRIDIHCSPCNLMRQPPARCLGHVPDCLAGIATADVLRAANEMLDAP